MARNALTMRAYDVSVPNVANLTNPLTQGLATYSEGMDKQYAGQMRRDEFAAQRGDADRSYELQKSQVDNAQAQRGFDNQFRQDQFKAQRGDADRSYSLQKSQVDDANRQKFEEAAAGVAQLIQNEKDPNIAAQNWQRLTGSDPRWKSVLDRYGVDPADYKRGAQVIISNARGYIPQDDGKINIVPDGGTAILTYPKTGEYKTIVSGTPKLSDGDKEAIREADDKVQGNSTVIKSLNKALELNKIAYGGYGASTAAYIGNNFNPYETPRSLATAQLEQVVTSQALESLKALFGAAPTEGERKILLEIQGSIKQPAAVREQIFNRAKDLAQERFVYQRQKAQQLRDRSYYQQGAATAPQQPSPDAVQRATLPNGKTAVKINGQWFEE